MFKICCRDFSTDELLRKVVHSFWGYLQTDELFVYFQVNNGVLYYRDYVEDIYIRALFVSVSTLNPNIVFTTSNKLYTTIRTSLFPFQFLKPKSCVISTTDVGLVFEGTLVIGLILRSLWGLYKIYETLWFYLVSL